MGGRIADHYVQTIKAGLMSSAVDLIVHACSLGFCLRPLPFPFFHQPYSRRPPARPPPCPLQTYLPSRHSRHTRLPRYLRKLLYNLYFLPARPVRRSSSIESASPRRLGRRSYTHLAGRAGSTILQNTPTDTPFGPIPLAASDRVAPHTPSVYLCSCKICTFSSPCLHTPVPYTLLRSYTLYPFVR
jgi:hypothetical protein